MLAHELLEYLALGAAGVALYLAVENNMPKIKATISNNLPSTIIPVSTTTAASPWEPIPEKKGVCPKGMYEDYTDGILRCHSAGGTRQLNPNVKMLQPQWANAWAAPPPPPPPNMTQPLVPPDINKEIESQKSPFML